MPWRWTIRGTCLTLLVICMGLWVLSYFYTAAVVHMGSSEFRAGVAGGRVEVAHIRVHLRGPFGLRASGWFTELYAVPPGRPFTLHLLDGRVLGFTVDPVLFAWRNWDVRIPFWFPTVLLALLSLSAWRNTGRGKPGRGFPVEPRASQRESSRPHSR